MHAECHAAHQACQAMAVGGLLLEHECTVRRVRDLYELQVAMNSFKELCLMLQGRIPAEWGQGFSALQSLHLGSPLLTGQDMPSCRRSALRQDDCSPGGTRLVASSSLLTTAPPPLVEEHPAIPACSPCSSQQHGPRPSWSSSGCSRILHPHHDVHAGC